VRFCSACRLVVSLSGGGVRVHGGAVLDGGFGGGGRRGGVGATDYNGVVLLRSRGAADSAFGVCRHSDQAELERLPIGDTADGGFTAVGVYRGLFDVLVDLVAHRDEGADTVEDILVDGFGVFLSGEAHGGAADSIRINAGAAGDADADLLVDVVIDQEGATVVQAVEADASGRAVEDFDAEPALNRCFGGPGELDGAVFGGGRVFGALGNGQRAVEVAGFDGGWGSGGGGRMGHGRITGECGESLAMLRRFAGHFKAWVSIGAGSYWWTLRRLSC
jgi:hypothetical protein